ncbi:Acyl-CoA N-acyltransferase [Hyaloscypha variabilis]
MSFDLKEASLSDIEELAEVLDKTYADEPIISQLMPSVDTKDRVEFWAGWFRNDFSKPGEKMFKMVEAESGKIVAFLKARYPAPKVVDAEEEQAEFPEGSNAELFGHWFGNMDHFEDKHMNYEEDYFVHVISTLPEYHRKGLGRRLLDRFLRDADDSGAKTYLQATEVGAGLYPRLGFKDIEEMVTNTPKGPVVWRCMMREPNPLKN